MSTLVVWRISRSLKRMEKAPTRGRLIFITFDLLYIILACRLADLWCRADVDDEEFSSPFDFFIFVVLKSLASASEARASRDGGTCDEMCLRLAGFTVDMPATKKPTLCAPGTLPGQRWADFPSRVSVRVPTQHSTLSSPYHKAL